MKKLEALADALSEYSGYADPKSKLYQLRNPGGLKAFSARYPSDPATGYRAFAGFKDGYGALLHDLEVKCKGVSNCGLKTDSPLLELVRVFGMKDETARYVVKFLRKALNNEQINEEVPIGLFLE